MKFHNFAFLALVVGLAIFGVFEVARAQGGDAARGAQLYAQNCAVCHGDQAQGRVGARLAKDFPGIQVNAFLKESISTGVSGSVMPAWATENGGPLTNQQIDDLVAFIRSLGHQAPTVPAGPTPTFASLPSPAATFPPGNANRGATVFVQNCAVCHGDHGQGRIGATLARDWPGIQPGVFIEATIARGVAGSKMPAWGLAYGGPLSDQEISDAAAFVQTLKLPGPTPAPAPDSIPQAGLLSNPLAFVCGGLIIIVGIAALGIGLAVSRAR